MPQATLDELLTLFEDFIRQRGIGVAIGFGELRIVAVFQNTHITQFDVETQLKRKPLNDNYSQRHDPTKKQTGDATTRAA